MTDRPIIFSGPMVRALLDGCKTQTRRVLKDQSAVRLVCVGDGGRFLPAQCFCEGGGLRWKYDAKSITECGDRLWVREAWQQSGFAWASRPAFGMGSLHYRATDDGGWKDYWGGWRSPIHMPRWASRLTLTVTDVRVQRVQEITYADVEAEGVVPPSGTAFSELWDSLNASRGYGWDANPWVVAVSFAVERRNIDEVAA